jgi:hypothetical protein
MMERLFGVLKFLGYSAFFFVAVLVFTIAGFPDEQLRETAQSHLTTALGVPVQVEKAALTGLVGVELQDVIIRLGKLKSEEEEQKAAEAEKKDISAKGNGPLKASAKGAAKAGKKTNKKTRLPPRLVDIKTLRFDASVWDIMWAASGAYEPDGGHREFEISAALQGGTIDAITLGIDQDKHVLDIGVTGIEGVALGGARLFKGLTGFDLRGVLEGNIQFATQFTKLFAKKTDPHPLAKVVAYALSKGATLSKTDVNLTIKGARILAPVIASKRMGTEYLTDVNLGDLSIKVKLKKRSELPGLKGRRASRRGGDTLLHIEEFNSNSPEVSIRVGEKSTIRLRRGRPFTQATIDIHIAIHLKRSFIEKKGKNARGEIGQHNKKIELFAKYEPTLKRAYRNGIIGVYCRGRLSKPRCGVERSRVRFEESGPNKGTRNTPAASKSKPRSSKARTGSKNRATTTTSSRRGVRPAARASGRGQPQSVRTTKTRPVSAANRRVSPTGTKRSMTAFGTKKNVPRLRRPVGTVKPPADDSDSDEGDNGEDGGDDESTSNDESSDDDDDESEDNPTGDDSGDDDDEGDDE